MGREGERLLFRVRVAAMDSFHLPSLPNTRLVIYVVSTTGQGEEPDNMKSSWRFLLRRSLPPTSLSMQEFCVLGLGDSGYPKFNHVAKKLHRRLLQLGGVSLQAPGLADDQHDLGPDFVVDSWFSRLWDILGHKYPLGEGQQPLPRDRLLPPKYNVQWLEGEGVGTGKAGNEEGTEGEREYSATNLFPAPLLSCARLTPPSHFQGTRLVRLDISGAGDGLKYSPGDIALVQPSNLQV